MVNCVQVESISQTLGAVSIEDDDPLILSIKSNITVDSKINSGLFDFQRRGVQFLYQSFLNGSGAILNDVPHSGKKVQVIAFISALILSRRQCSGERSGPNDHPALVICPKSKINIWENRIKHWSSLKYSVCSDLNISKAADSTDVVLFPFDLLAKSVVNVAKRNWMVLFLDNIELITEKPKYEPLLHHLPRVLRFGISSKNLNNKECLAAVVGWVYPKYYEQFKKDKAKILSLMQQFDDKTGTVADQIRGLHLKAHLLSLRNKFFVKREGEIPSTLSSLPRDVEEEEELDCLPSTSRNPSLAKPNKRKASEKRVPKSKSPRTNSNTAPSTSHDEFETILDERSETKKKESVRRSTRRNSGSKNTEDTADHLPQTSTSSSSKTKREQIEAQPCCSTWSNAKDGPREDFSSSELASSQSTSEYDPIDALLFSSNKVLKSPQKSRKRAPVSESLNSESSSVEADFETQQLALLDSLFLKTPPASKPAPSKFRSFTRASQKTNICQSEDSKFSAKVGGGTMSQDFDSFFSETQVRKPPPRLLGESNKTCYSQRPDDLLDDLLFSKPVTRKAPPKRRGFTQPDTNVDAGKSSVRQPMQTIKNLDLPDSQIF